MWLSAASPALYSLASDSAPNALSSNDPVSWLLQYGPFGILLALMLFGLIVAKPTVDQIVSDRDAWKGSYEREREAHAQTRASLANATQVASVALESGKITEKMLDHFGHTRVDP